MAYRGRAGGMLNLKGSSGARKKSIWDKKKSDSDESTKSKFQKKRRRR